MFRGSTASRCRTFITPPWGPSATAPSGASFIMLSDVSLNRILERLPDLTIGVLGDLFLDRYLEIDRALTEPSLETGLDAYQVVRVRPSPGAAGTVINNL